MSIYRCDMCEEYRDRDFHGCNEDSRNDCKCICDSCEENLSLDEEV